MRFDIQYSSAVQTVGATNALLPSLSSATDDSTQSLIDAGSALQHSPVVTAALSALGTEVAEPTASAMNSHSGNATSCTSTALNFYNTADGTMASTASTNSANAVVTDMPGVR